MGDGIDGPRGLAGSPSTRDVVNTASSLFGYGLGMRYPLAAALVLCASCASAGPLDFLKGIPDAPGVVSGGSFGPSGNDYYGDMHVGGPRRNMRTENTPTSRQARAKPRHPIVDKRIPRS